ncbi:High-copy suppressor of rspA [Cedecea davisae]|uniref:Transporter, major facilitator family protein n=1 Tax=Cedecea davisae DSM 4568 TaxID=566551 RepID=S3IRX9_9ENTR|nr:MFS transporter [Cedecea davisae]EPF16528.1 transporter, major facilitator family protein [Cedecea davisae DSM 4568]SUX38713.1 High-copy suppressor of rspA [Cedecea davisae]
MPYRHKVAAVYLLGFFLDLINMFISNVAYPQIGRELHATVAELAWIGHGYLCGLTLVIPISAWLTQRLGAKRLFMLSLGLFSLGTLASGMSPGLEALVASRILQGIGGGLLIPVGQALTWQLFAVHERAKLSSVIMIVALLAPALSPTVGGLLVESLGWRWIFLASLPLALLTLLLASLWLQPSPVQKSNTPLDAKGLALGSVGLFAILLGLTQASSPGAHLSALLLLAAGALMLWLFVRHNSKHLHPLFSLPLLADPLLRYAMLVYQCIPGLFMGTSLVSIIYLQTQLGMTATQTGALMVPWALASFVAISFTGRMFNRLGPRPLITLGGLLQAAGILLLTQVTSGEQIALLIAAYILMGLGGSLSSSTAQSTAFISTPARVMPEASALWNINRQLSFCFGVALLSLLLTVLQSQLPAQQAYLLTFSFAAAGTIIPLAYHLRLNNQQIKKQLIKKES